MAEARRRLHADCSAIVLLVLILCGGCARKPPYEGRSVAELERMLTDADPNVQVQGAYGLSLRGSAAHPATPALIRSLKSEDALVRQQACVALGKIGSEAQQATPALIAALADPEWTVRRQAAVSLGQIGPLAPVEAPLENCRRDPSSLVRKAAAESLTTLRKSKSDKN